MLALQKEGLFSARGQFYIDPWRAVKTAVITHAHGDHATFGSQEYYCSEPCAPLLQSRLGSAAQLRPVPYGEKFHLGGCILSFHPAGHILGSSQVRVEAGGEVWVVSGDYKRDPDPTCAPFEVVPCDTFISEATFALPVYRWKSGEEIGRQIFEWWQECKERGTTALLLCYSLGKAQRVLAELARFTDEKAYLHGAAVELTDLYRRQGVKMIPTEKVSTEEKKPTDFYKGALVLAPPSAAGSSWVKRFRKYETGFASGWMQIRGKMKQKGYDRGFVLSDHADWPSLVRTIHETGAKKIFLTHGYSDLLVRYLQEEGIEAETLQTEFHGEGES
jgi:putative mRNA 3-end processing factor